MEMIQILIPNPSSEASEGRRKEQKKRDFSLLPSSLSHAVREGKGEPLQQF